MTDASSDPEDRPTNTGTDADRSDERSPTDTVDAEEDPENILEEIERKRSLRGWSVVLVAVVGILFSAFQMWLSARGFIVEVTVPLAGTYRITSFETLQIRSVHVTFALIMAFLLYPPLTGAGRLTRSIGGFLDVVSNRVGGSIAAAIAFLRRAVRWFCFDPNKERITPLDGLLIVSALLPVVYFFRRYDEYQNVIRVLGLQNAATIDEIFPALEPLAVGPLATYSVAYLLGILGVLLVLEATRRALGLLLTGLVSIFVLYGRYGYLIPSDMAGIGQLAVRENRWDQVISYLWYTGEGIFGIPVSVSVRFIYIFILFGAFLEMSGAGKWFIDFAYSLTGTRKGGPAKASVVSSGFMGMLSGSSVANTVTTGAFTIPLMKRSGYSPEFAGAVESSTSSGGQILPPVMGAAAFLIVEYTGTPFRDVIVAATIPAVAFFFGMWVMVHFEAAKHDIGGLAREQLLDLKPHIKRGWFYLFPIVLLLYYIVGARLSIGRAGWLTIVATIAIVALVAAYNERTRGIIAGGLAVALAANIASYATAGVGLITLAFGGSGESLPVAAALRAGLGDLDAIAILLGVAVLLYDRSGTAPLLSLDSAVDDTADAIDDRLGRPVAASRAGRFATFILKSMEAGARTATVVVVAVAAAGIIPGIIGLTGLGPNLARLIVTVSAGSFVVLLLLAGVSAIIVGMGMPTTVMYIILVAMLGRAFPEFGVPLLAVHLYILYLGLMADVTPPVAVAAFAASGVAKSEPIETAIQAFLLSLNKILVPFAFVFTPGIMLLRPDGDPGETNLLSWADVTDFGFFVPEVVVPILGMFAGVYALGICIIGYFRAPVSRVQRVLYGVAALLLSVPGLVLLPTESLLGLLGVSVVLETLAADLLLRGVGAALFITLLEKGRREGRKESPSEPASPTAS
ncbi:TRAP-type transport system permease protein [Natronomonas pharaonis DSM 2160]|uniref:TRAP-type transport system permease protein n=1 Tax=Natronomonas pharaonis (strain ATCC 35678 / DSM 2160 / CIP 103997 / JCM 8858 / NBRC 14720 / NCIMB 2260 / Gabara) TaxID=348780 RepID=A0A1U7ETU8_NATPD|nr:TRAP transporter permease [Natronomonas pharaonis]CAI48361.1 TRAP-type transport system permease protein [Natronomonas pharaonis DSM 2160]